MTATTAQSLTVALHDSFTPGLPGGKYCLTINQELRDRENNLVDSGKYFLPLKQEFTVFAPRFSVDGTLVHAVNPPPGTQGGYDDLLPHVTLSHPQLPWERNIGDGVTGPWVALLLFRADEILDDPDARGLTTPRTAKELITTSADVATPDIKDTSLADAAEPCRTIEVAADTFAKLAPRAADLPFLAHCRKVTQPRTARGEELKPGYFGVVLAHRLPREPGPWVAHLVSLEGHGKHLAGLGSARRIRLASLWSWSFRAVKTDAARQFPALVRGLAADQQRLTLRLPAKASGNTGVDTRLKQGYVPVPTRVRSGEHTFAWYRGPGGPVVAQPPPALDPDGTAVTSDHALSYLPDTGMFDLSYAAAWALGRSAAMADADYVAGLLRWRHRSRHHIARHLVGQAPQIWRDELNQLLAQDLGTTLDASAAPAEASLSPAPAGLAEIAAHWESTRDSGELGADLAGIGRDEPVLGDWLSRLCLLEPVPFHYLVPDARMLPPESLRFFHIDPDWIGALVSGALSLGSCLSTDVVANTAASRGKFPAPVAGFLIRSALVSGWPDLVLTAVAKDTGKSFHEVRPLRHDRLAPDVLLCLYDEVPDELCVDEPKQGLNFGVDPGNTLRLRSLDKETCGTPLKGKTASIADCFRPNAATGVLDVGGTGGTSLQKTLDTALGKTLSAAKLAVQLVNSPQRFVFHAGGTK
ncbi:hypothetical protein BS329_34010 [Amycolatopsis coloradensis]|uniref:Uncharacterized protein n=1 Tax=Amycolatopsis coloradensis TaxID=76021 RepID=A0A1R0KI41_9PSEU|nr:hypothetical protein [Amycolatopsis coloradensis]OLZ45440.1 hypothetical protein BS329_34010 [Amycolatopsis coloradensis]